MNKEIEELIRDLCSVDFREKSITRKRIESFVSEYKNNPLQEEDKRRIMTKEYKEKLIALAQGLIKESDEFFELSEGSLGTSKQRSDAEMKLVGSIHYLVGFIESLEDEEV